VTGPLELLAGAPGAAEGELRRSDRLLGELGDRYVRPTVAGLLAEALYRQGRYDEAGRFTELSEELAASDDIWSQFLWRAKRAKLIARQGDFRRAEQLARDAVALVNQTDMLDGHANVLIDLAEVLILAGRKGDARPVVADALALYEAKGNLVSARDARTVLEECLDA
jgi:tetratricopeptide (TPR) repeat protein